MKTIFELLTNPKREILEAFINENDEKPLIEFYDDEFGENGYNIRETEHYYVFTKWVDGQNDMNVYILK